MNSNCSTLRSISVAFLFSLLSFDASCTVFTVPFTPYNCAISGYDTLIQCSVGDRIIFLNMTAGPFSANYFLEKNGLVIDTVQSVQGDTIWDVYTGISDTLFSIHVWAMPGMCYGQRFHLQRPVGLEVPGEGPLFHIHDHLLSFANLDAEAEVRIFDLHGCLLAGFHVFPTDDEIIQIPDRISGLVVVLIIKNGVAHRFKTIFP